MTGIFLALVKDTAEIMSGVILINNDEVNDHLQGLSGRISGLSVQSYRCIRTADYVRQNICEFRGQDQG